jgi:hypothetical protein
MREIVERDPQEGSDSENLDDVGAACHRYNSNLRDADIVHGADSASKKRPDPATVAAHVATISRNLPNALAVDRGRRSNAKWGAPVRRHPVRFYHLERGIFVSFWRHATPICDGIAQFVLRFHGPGRRPTE